MSNPVRPPANSSDQEIMRCLTELTHKVNRGEVVVQSGSIEVTETPSGKLLEIKKSVGGGGTAQPQVWL